MKKIILFAFLSAFAVLLYSQEALKSSNPEKAVPASGSAWWRCFQPDIRQNYRLQICYTSLP
jgi:hypothetical protein